MPTYKTKESIPMGKSNGCKTNRYKILVDSTEFEKITGKFIKAEITFLKI